MIQLSEHVCIFSEAIIHYKDTNLGTKKFPGFYTRYCKSSNIRTRGGMSLVFSKPAQSRAFKIRLSRAFESVGLSSLELFPYLVKFKLQARASELELRLIPPLIRTKKASALLDRPHPAHPRFKLRLKFIKENRKIQT